MHIPLLHLDRKNNVRVLIYKILSAQSFSIFKQSDEVWIPKYGLVKLVDLCSWSNEFSTVSENHTHNQQTTSNLNV